MQARRSVRAPVLAALLLGAVDAGADIYASHVPGEPPKFATRRVDATYRLLLRTQPEAPQAGNGTRRVHDRAGIEAIVERVAARHAVDPALVRAVIEVESRFQAHAVSPKGATGVMQLMPDTARRYGVRDRTDVVRNIEGGVAYLGDLLGRFGGNVALAAAAYNAGEGAVDRHGRGIPRYRETMLYVPRVLEAYARYRAEAAARPPPQGGDRAAGAASGRRSD